MPFPEFLTQQLLEGVCLFGTADLNKLDASDFLLEPGLIRELHLALSLAMPVSPTVLATLKDHPNQLYFHHYRQLNNLLDQTALKLVRGIEGRGYRALAIPASQIVDWQNQRAHLSHKRIAVAAGLGWIGRNNLLVTPQYGSQLRLVTILTDMPMPPGPQKIRGHDSASCPLECHGCAQCRACIAVCPAGAIKESATDFDHQACFAQLKEFQRQGHVGQYICGLCVRACPGKTQNLEGK